MSKDRDSTYLEKSHWNRVTLEFIENTIVAKSFVHYYIVDRGRKRLISDKRDRRRLISVERCTKRPSSILTYRNAQ